MDKVVEEIGKKGNCSSISSSHALISETDFSMVGTAHRYLLWSFSKTSFRSRSSSVDG